MDRRHFLQSSSLAVLAAAGLPRAVRAMQQTPSGSVYRSKPEADKSGQWLFEVTIFHRGFEFPDQATAEEKIVSVKAAYFETTDFTKPSKEGVSQYIIKDAIKEPDTATTSIYFISTNFDKKISGDKLGKEFYKALKMRCTEYSKLEILNKEGGTLYSLPYPSTTIDGKPRECFLTTACVQQQQLPDDCEALQTLRMLRDNYMTDSTDGTEMIKQYSAIGPSIVRSINNCTNKEDIYGYMYTNMILPSVQLVKDGKHAEAVEYYKLFVGALLEQYN